MRKVKISSLETPADVFALIASKKGKPLSIRMQDILQGKVRKEDDDLVEELLNHIKSKDLQEAEDLLEVIEGKIKEIETYVEYINPHLGNSQRITESIFNDVPIDFPDLVYEAYITNREKVFSEYVAREAAKNLKVAQFRQTYFGHQSAVLTNVQALSFLASPACQVLTREFFESHDIPYLSHLAERVKFETDELTNRASMTLKVTPPGKTFTVDTAQDHISSITYLYDETTYDVKTGQEFSNIWQDRIDLTWRGGSAVGSCIDMVVWPRSIIAELRQIGHELEAFFSWSEVEAIWFVLTGTTPLLRALKVSSYEWYPIRGMVPRRILNIQVEPWIPANTISKLYRGIQHELFGRDNYQIGERTLAVLQFGLKYEVDQKKSPMWNHLVKEWNTIYPEWHYEGGKRLASAYSRAKQIYEKQLELSMNRKARKEHG